MGGRIDCYIDIASFYSYLGFVYLVENLRTLESHGVQVEFHPVLLGGIMAKSGNNPPWFNKAKAKYGSIEGRRVTARAGKPEIQFPEDLMPMSHTVLPLRALHYVKANYPREIYHATWAHLFQRFWTPPNLNLTKVDVLAQVLSESKEFSPEECEQILAAAKSQEAKDALTKATQSALDKGAFGAPWLWVRNDKGEAEPFFGSDRFHFVYKYLGLPHQDIALLPPGAKPKL
ncbi:putative dsba-like thioredoxin domain-containing protein [Diaporthe ampelina]|uniref:Glutathione S-transferase kappa n=1 Tax=Diaporthe ampelina TaxID=1214573 RepID=A0A0G2FXP7_9PEZI|nr:putative dsba-like thioredoxin domain-containing protein [Diaporthe ampelina]